MRPYGTWLRRHMTICHVLSGGCLLIALIALGVGVNGLYDGSRWTTVSGAVLAVVFALVSEQYAKDASQLWRALQAWEQGQNELKHLPKRLQREIE